MPRTEDAAGECSNVTLCDNCCKALEKPFVCARCKTATYCSKDCQCKAWKAGHKGDCALAHEQRAATGTRKAAKPTADQTRVLEILEQLVGAADWRGVAAQERAARAVAAAVRTWMPSKARRSTASSETRIGRWGAFPRRSSTTRSTWRFQRSWATGRGRAWRTQTSGTRINRRAHMRRPLSTTRST